MVMIVPKCLENMQTWALKMALVACVPWGPSNITPFHQSWHFAHWERREAAWVQHSAGAASGGLGLCLVPFGLNNSKGTNGLSIPHDNDDIHNYCYTCTWSILVVTFLPLEFGMVVSAAKKKNCRCKIQSFMIFGSMKLQSTENTLQLTLPSPQIFLTVASEFGKLVDDKFRFNLVWTQDCPFNFLERYSSWLSCNTAYKILWHRVVETCRI